MLCAIFSRLLYTAHADGSESIHSVVASINDVDRLVNRNIILEATSEGWGLWHQNLLRQHKSFPQFLVAVGQHLPSGQIICADGLMEET